MDVNMVMLKKYFEIQENDVIVIKRVIQYKIKYYYFYYCDFFFNPNYLRLLFWLNVLLSFRYNDKHFRASKHQMK